LPEKHSFPRSKYGLLRKRIMESDIAPRVDLKIPRPATDEEILRAHDSVYIHRLQNGELSDKEVRRVGLPWSAEIVRRARYSSGGTIEACRAALEAGIAVNLGGGTHHAFSDHGQGYCWLNDSVIAARAIQAEGLVNNILIVDCDVHQGNGTAAIVENDPTIFTFSIHGKNNFPFQKAKSDLDIALEDGAGDAVYLEALERGLLKAMDAAGADLVIYLAGADPYQDDRFSRIALTKTGLAERDRFVFQRCRQAGLPLVVTMAGGYARNVEDTVDIHFQTVLAALEYKNPGWKHRKNSLKDANKS
jgi:acetoin utilization deacetylase AcuC-like enzyme